MKPVKLWRTPKIIGENNKNKIFYISSNSLIRDNESRTLWIDLESENFLKKQKGSFNVAIKRKKIGLSSDFTLLLSNFILDYTINSKVLDLFNDATFWSFFFKQQSNLEFFSIREKVNFLIGTMSQINKAKEEGQQIQLPENILKKLNLSQIDIDILNNLVKFLEKIPKKSMADLIQNSRYSLLLGELTLDEEMENNVATEEDNIKKPKITTIEIAKYFEDIILEENIKLKFYSAMSLPNILNGKKPNMGGAILLDHGGTGKSLLKSRIKKLFRKMGAEVKEKTQGDITSYVNAGPQVIKKWYRGGPSDEVTGPEEKDLVKEAKKNGIPSLLILDEAEEFIKEKTGDQKDSINALNTLKRYIQDAQKGGVTGYVITLLIANMDEKDIHTPLQQGAERLTSIYVGPPNSLNIWEGVIKNIFEEQAKLEFQNNLNISLLAKILFEYQKLCSHERYNITPRNLYAYCSNYYSLHTKNENNYSSDKDYFENITKEELVKKWDINFIEFCENLIDELILDEIRNDPKNKDKSNEIIKKLHNLLHQIEIKDEQHSTKKITQPIISDKEKTTLQLIKQLIVQLDKIYPKEKLKIENDDEKEIINRLILFLGKLLEELNSKEENDENKDSLIDLKTRTTLVIDMLNAAINNKEFKTSSYNLISTNIHFILEHIK